MALTDTRSDAPVFSSTAISAASIAFRSLVKNGRTFCGMIIIGILVVTALGAPWIAPKDPVEMHRSHVFTRPFGEGGFFLGTDQHGRDVLSRLLHGGRISLVVGFSAVILQTALGVILGLLSGYYGSVADHIIMRVIDVIYPFPRLLLALFLVSIMGHSTIALIFVIAIGGVPRMSRIIRSSVLSVKQRTYIAAAKAAGLRDSTILFFYVLPNVIAPVIVLATLDLAQAVTTEASLSFLGLGADPTIPTWGSMLSEGRPYLRVYPYLCIFPGLAISIAVLGFNAFGDGLRDILDPRLKRGLWRA